MSNEAIAILLYSLQMGRRRPVYAL